MTFLQAQTKTDTVPVNNYNKINQCDSVLGLHVRRWSVIWSWVELGLYGFVPSSTWRASWLFDGDLELTVDPMRPVAI